MSSYQDYVRTINDFPKQGVVFKDINPIFASSSTFNNLLANMDLMTPLGISYVLGIEARGFILGSALANRLGVGFIPIRKAGKLPPPTASLTYSKEYGTDELGITIPDVSDRGKSVIIVDDILATGGTALASYELVSTYYNVKLLSFVGAIPSLGGVELLTGRGVYHSYLMSL